MNRAVSLTEALKIAREVASTLEEAHQKGIAHGSLSSRTVKIGADGKVEVVGFAAVPGDTKSDISSFGGLLFELLSGDVISDPPDWQRLPESTPERIRVLLKRCRHKDPTRRIHDIGDAMLEIDEALEEKVLPVNTAAPVARWREKVFAAVLVVFLASTVWLAALFLSSTGAEGSSAPPVSSGQAHSGPMPIRFDVGAPFNPIRRSSNPPRFFPSPDGQKIAFVTLGTNAGIPPRIWVRVLSESLPTGVANASGTLLAWSPDSKFLAFVEDGKLKKVLSGGGSAEVICDLSGAAVGLAWGADDALLFGQRAGPLMKVSANGGKPEPATTLDGERNEQAHSYPVFLPDGKRFIYAALATTGNSAAYAAYVGEVGSPSRQPLPGIASEARYLNGHLLFIRDLNLMAQPFDLERLTLNGEAFIVSLDFLALPAPTGPFSVSSTGILSFTKTGTSTAADHSRLVWFDEKGSTNKVVGTAGIYAGPEMSPDGKSVAFSRPDSTGAGRDIWILDVETGGMDRLTGGGGNDTNPRWAPDSKRIAFVSAREGGTSIYERTVDVVGPDKPLLKNDQDKVLLDWSPDGEYLIYASKGDIWALPYGKSDPIQITNTPAAESNARVSRDGHWIAVVTDEKGPDKPREIYIQSFPRPGLRKALTEGGGSTPRWSSDGKTIFFIGATTESMRTLPRMLMATPVTTTANSLDIGVPGVLFSIAVTANGVINVMPGYNVAPDRRFLVQQTVASTSQAERPAGSTSGITVILNWAGK